MDPGSVHDLMLVRLRSFNATKPFYANDLLSFWAYQGGTEFNGENLKYLVIEVEKMGYWHNRLDPDMAAGTKSPWRDYLRGSERFLSQQIMKPRCSDPMHEHINDKPYSYYRCFNFPPTISNYCFCCFEFHIKLSVPVPAKKVL